ncbi:MAG: hypothetical protein QOF65_2079, partial [Thermoleophilaceae bacterium]|nr:hypothetical protein [Thermoleophilaceae bacterium]
RGGSPLTSARGGPERLDAVAAVAPGKESLHRREVEDLEPFGLLDHPDHLPHGQHLGVIQQRAGKAGHGDGVELRPIVWMQ